MSDNLSSLRQKGVVGSSLSLPSDVIYTPPSGKIVISGSSPLRQYMQSDPTNQTDLLQSCERKYIMPTAMLMAKNIFRVPPITDDMYRFIDSDMKGRSMFFILSRSNAEKHTSGYIIWEPFIVVIKGLIVVAVKCAYHPQKKDFKIINVTLWQNGSNNYYLVQDQELTLEMLPLLIEKYMRLEKVLDLNQGQEGLIL